MGVDYSRLPRLQITKNVVSNSDTYQAQGRQSCSSSHASHLSIASLANAHFQPRCWHGLAESHGWIARPQPARFAFERSHLGGQGRSILECHARAQRIQCCNGRFTFDLDQIGFGLPVPGVGSAMGQRTIVGTRTPPS